MSAKDDYPLVMMTHPADPERCQGVTAAGQCQHKGIPGKQYCAVHISSTLRCEERSNQRNYRIAKWRARLEEFADNPQVKGLREEIGLLRILLEELVNTCTDSTKLILASNKISDLILKIEKLVSSCHRLEKSTGMLLDKSSAIQLASKFVQIIAEEVDDPVLIEKISDKLISEIQNLKPSEARDE